jgi:hypothetical protein
VSRAVSLLELVRDVAQRHDVGPRGQIRVISLLVDDLGEAKSALAALAGTTRGRLFTATDDDLQVPVPATTDVVRRAAVGTQLTQAPDGLKVVTVSHVGTDRLDASFVGTPPGGLSPGERTVLAVARALLHSGLDERELAIIAYKADLVDLAFQRAIWRLATVQLDGMPHGTLRTLVFVAEVPEISIKLHCQPGQGVDLGVLGDRLFRRKRINDLQATAGELAHDHGPIVLFLGAGFSASSGFPIGNALRDSAIRIVTATPADEELTSDALAERFHALLQQRGWLTATEGAMPIPTFAHSLTLERVIQVQSATHSDLPTLQDFAQLHANLVHLPGAAVLDLAHVLEHAGRRILLLGLNFDRLIEENTDANIRVFSTMPAFRDAASYVRRYLEGNEDAIPYLKFHGCISSLPSCVVSVDQTQLGMGSVKLSALRAVLRRPRPRRWIYVGCSLRDLDLRPTLLHESFARSVDERWVNPFMLESFDEFVEKRAPFWSATGRKTFDERLTTETADSFFAALRHAW